MLKILLHRITDTEREEKEDPPFFALAHSETFREAGRFKNNRSRYCRIAGDAMARYGLNLFFGIAPEEIRIRRKAKGKPFLADARNVFFNISHSGEYIVCAFSRQEIGIDTERIGRARMEVARRFFHPEEIAVLEGVDPEERDALFFRYWSVKEAFLKYTGTGLTRPLSSFCIRESGERIYLYAEGKEIGVTVRACEFDPRYASCVCTGQDEGEAEIIPFPSV